MQLSGTQEQLLTFTVRWSRELSRSLRLLLRMKVQPAVRQDVLRRLGCTLRQSLSAAQPKRVPAVPRRTGPFRRPACCWRLSSICFFTSSTSLPGTNLGPSSTSSPKAALPGRISTAWLRTGSRRIPLGSPPSSTTLMSSAKRLRSVMMPRSLSPRCSFWRSLWAPWPTQAMMSWLTVLLLTQRPVSGSYSGDHQYGIVFCSKGSSPGSGSLTHPRLKVLWSSTGTRNSK